MALSESAFDEQLIECVRLYPVLYMSSSKSNKNKVAKENAWKLIADDLHTTGILGVLKKVFIMIAIGIAEILD